MSAVTIESGDGGSGDGGSGDGIHGLARRLGAYAWVEDLLATTLGEWARLVDDDEVTRLLAEAAQHHAWHVTLWTDRLPTIPGVDRDAVVTPSSTALSWFADAFADPDRDGAIEMLAGTYRVAVPRLVAELGAHRSVVDARVDPPTARTLDLVLADLRVDLERGETALQANLRTADDVERAATHQALLESLVVAAGGLTTATDGLGGTGS